MPSSSRITAACFCKAAVVALTILVLAPTLVHAEQYTLEQAQSLIDDGSAIEAKHVLMTIKKRTADPGERETVLEMLAAAERRIGLMDRADVSLQKAELALKQGDVRNAELHANATRRLDSAEMEQRQLASDILDEAARLRIELEPLIQPAIEQAVRDFKNEQFSEAKAGFASVVRSGVKLSSGQLSSINSYQEKIYEVERQVGSPFELEYIPLGVLRAAAEPQTEIQQAETHADVTEPAIELADVYEVPIEQEPAVIEIAELEAIDHLAFAEMQDVTETEVEDDYELEEFTTTDADQQDVEPDFSDATDDLFNDAGRFDAQRVLSEADAAYAAGRYNQAVSLYNQATTTYAQHLSVEELASARDRLLDSRTRLGQGGVNVLDPFANDRQFMREQALAEYNNYVNRATGSLDGGNTSEARNLIAQARLQWANAFNNGLFAEQEYRAKEQDLANLLNQIAATEEQITATNINSRAIDLEREAAEQSVRQDAERQKKIDGALNRLRELQSELKYEEALQVVDQVLFLDPNNAAALLMKDVLKDVIFYREWEEIQRDKAYSYAGESVEMQRDLIIPEGIMSYPPDWPELSFRRGDVQSFVESDIDRRVLATLETTRIPASFTDVPLENALEFIATLTNVNMDVDWEALADVGIERDTEISLELREVSARVVLDRVLEKVSPDEFTSADWAIADGILLVASGDRLRENTFIVIYDVRDLLFEVPDFTAVPSLDLDQILQQSSSSGGGGGGSIFADDETGGGLVLTPEELLNRLLEIIQTNVDPNGWIDAGGETGAIQPLNGNLIITNTAKNHREIQGLLNQLREIRAIQISVEARFLSVIQDFFEHIGFDMDVYFNAQNNQFRDAEAQLRAWGAGSLAGEGLSITPRDVAGGAFSTGGGTAGPGWYVTDFDQQNNTVTYGFQPDGQSFSISQPSTLSIIPVQSGATAITETLINSPFAAEVLALNPALAIAGTFLDDIQVDFLVEATQADRRNVSLTAPRLTFMNGKQANIFVVTQQAFVSDLTPVVGTGSVAFDPTVQSLQSGFTLALQGVVSADRRYVTLTVQTGISTVGEFGEGTVSAVAGGNGDNSSASIATGTFQLPLIAVTQISTGATIPDKGTLLLGGQRLVTEVEVETGVPVLSKLPILNRFFTNRIETKEEQTLLILVKPTIIIQNEEEERAFPGLLDQLQNPLR